MGQKTLACIVKARSITGLVSGLDWLIKKRLSLTLELGRWARGVHIERRSDGEGYGGEGGYKGLLVLLPSPPEWITKYYARYGQVALCARRD
jgi:hypothetical protein